MIKFLFEFAMLKRMPTFFSAKVVGGCGARLFTFGTGRNFTLWNSATTDGGSSGFVDESMSGLYLIALIFYKHCFDYELVARSVRYSGEYLEM